MISAFQDSPLLLLFVVIGIGYAIGNISIFKAKLGVAAVLFVGLAFLFYAFDLSLSSQKGFDQVVNTLQTNFLAKFVIWGVVSALMYHLVAGVKHLLMDLGHFEELESGRIAAIVNIVLAAILIVLAGVWIW